MIKHSGKIKFLVQNTSSSNSVMTSMEQEEKKQGRVLSNSTIQYKVMVKLYY